LIICLLHWHSLLVIGWLVWLSNWLSSRKRCLLRVNWLALWWLHQRSLHHRLSHGILLLRRRHTHWRRRRHAHWRRRIKAIVVIIYLFLLIRHWRVLVLVILEIGVFNRFHSWKDWGVLMRPFFDKLIIYWKFCKYGERSSHSRDLSTSPSLVNLQFHYTIRSHYFNLSLPPPDQDLKRKKQLEPFLTLWISSLPGNTLFYLAAKGVKSKNIWKKINSFSQVI